MEEGFNKEWFEKVSKAAGIAQQEVVGEVKKEQEAVVEVLENPKKRKNLFIFLGIFLLALLPRLYFIFFVSGTQNAGIGWYNDSYHHWQIAYLTQQIGFHKEFLRLWDLQGLEYFWGFLHPFILSLLFTITGSADIIVSRIFNVILGSATISLIYFLIKREFKWQAALGAVILTILSPVGIFTDTSGMQEPLAIFVFLLGIYFWPKRPILTAVFWFLASMTRGEYWVFSIILILAVLIFDKNYAKKLSLVITYVLTIGIYMKYLLDKTGNAIYPIYWNFLGNAAGKWEKDIPLTQTQIEVRYVFIVLFVVSLIIALFLIRKKPKIYIFSLLGVGNLMFLSLFIGMTQYLKSYLPRFWVDRIFQISYLWIFCMLAVFALYFLPKHLKAVGRITGWVLVIATATLIQGFWQPINFYRVWQSKGVWENEYSLAKNIMSFYTGGAVLIPGNDPIFTYALYKNGLVGANIRGEMFDPYYYISGDPYLNWWKNRKTVLNFFKTEGITLLVFSSDEKRYVKLVTIEKNSFKKDGTFGNLEVYDVKL